MMTLFKNKTQHKNSFILHFLPLGNELAAVVATTRRSAVPHQHHLSLSNLATNTTSWQQPPPSTTTHQFNLTFPTNIINPLTFSLHHQQHFLPNTTTTPSPSSATTTFNVGIGVFPFLTCDKKGDDHHLLNGDFGNFGGFVTSTSNSTCWDCGNKAKKDCGYRRCRACCKNNGFDCSTHVKSTWVSAAQRRERETDVAAAAVPGSGGSSGSSSSAAAPAKRPRIVTSQNATPPPHQDARFKETLPRSIRTQAAFKCIRVSAIANAEDEFGYQAIVHINGHVFKGFLYDQGITINHKHGFPSNSTLNLDTTSIACGGGGTQNIDSKSSSILDTTTATYTTSLGGRGLLQGHD